MTSASGDERAVIVEALASLVLDGLDGEDAAATSEDARQPAEGAR
jgi:hypothetical protein